MFHMQVPLLFCKLFSYLLLLWEESTIKAVQVFLAKAPALAQRLSCESEGYVHSMYTIWILEQSFWVEMVEW